MNEREMENLIAAYPNEFFPRKNMVLIGRQETFSGIGRFDLLFEGELGYADKAEKVLIEAYRQGSLEAETLAREMYKARTGKEEGFSEYFVAKLTTDSPTAEQRPAAPKFQARRLDGTLVDSDSLRGQVVVVNFWFTTCAPCIGEMPDLNKLVDEFQGKVRFLAFATDPPGRIDEFLETHVFKYEIFSAAELSRLFGISSYPTHFIIDRQGRIAWKGHGAGPENLKRLRAMIARLLN